MELFDLHCDTLCEALHKNACIHSNVGALDLERGRAFHPWYQFFAAWIPDCLSIEEARAECDSLLAVAERWRSESEFVWIGNSADFSFCTPGCHGILAVENGGALNPDEAYLAELFARGVRMITLTWNGDNHWGSGCGGTSSGLTTAGQWAVSVMEKLRIVVDAAHLNECGFWELNAQATLPFIVSHTASGSVHSHRRNISDEQFCAIRDRGGLVGLSLYPEHLGGSQMEDIARHLEHFLALGGERTVCFGADFDGMTAPPEWNGISIMKKIKQYLRNAGWSPELLQAVFYTNARDFFARHWSQNTRNEE